MTAFTPKLSQKLLLRGTSWPVWDTKNPTNFKISPETTAYSPHSCLVFTSHNNAHAHLKASFFLNKEAAASDLILSMEGQAPSLDPTPCLFDLHINGVFVQRFETIDDWWKGNITYLTIPKQYFQTGENSLDLRIVGHPSACAYVCNNQIYSNSYYLSKLLLSKDPMPHPYVNSSKSSCDWSDDW